MMSKGVIYVLYCSDTCVMCVYVVCVFLGAVVGYSYITFSSDDQ